MVVDFLFIISVHNDTILCAFINFVKETCNKFESRTDPRNVKVCIHVDFSDDFSK
jgi:hypothetical protein